VFVSASNVVPHVCLHTSILSHFLFFLHDPAPPEIYTLSLHDALPISTTGDRSWTSAPWRMAASASPLTYLSGWRPKTSTGWRWRSEEHTSELQSRGQLVCRLLLEKKKEG